MGDKTGISWTQGEDGTPGSTWNPIVGCSKVSPGCANCYAETLALRWGWTPHPWLPEFASENVILKPDRLDQPIRWKRPRKIFVNSLSDLFHEQVPDDFIDRVFAVMALAKQHTYQVLTKRPERMRDYMRYNNNGDSYDFEDRHSRVLDAVDERLGKYAVERGSTAWSKIIQDPRRAFEWPLPNVWLGTSVENARWRTRIDFLRATPAAVRFLSCEPLLGPLADPTEPWTQQQAETGQLAPFDLTGIDWCIIGGESGPGARKMDEQWVRDIVASCRRQMVAVWVKQFGEVWSREHLGHSGHADQIEDFPPDLRIQDFPAAEEEAAEQGAFAF